MVAKTGASTQNFSCNQYEHSAKNKHQHINDNMNKSILLFSFLTVIFLTSCNNNQNSVKAVSKDTTTIKELTVKWNDCLIKQDLQTLATLYAEQVSLYGTSISKEQAVSNKEGFFKKYSDFNQSITGDITVTKVTDQQYKVRFPKRSTFNGKTSDVQGYLLFDKVSDKWKITNESDDLTDKNITNIDTKEKRELKTCIDIVMEILITSPVYLKKTKGLYEAVVKNGGTSFGIIIEGSPNPKSDEAMDFSNTYDFSLHETYPDHNATIGHFSFNPTQRQLYEYDVAEDKSNPIDFDRNLLLKFNEICK